MDFWNGRDFSDWNSKTNNAGAQGSNSGKNESTANDNFDRTSNGNGEQKGYTQGCYNGGYGNYYDDNNCGNGCNSGGSYGNNYGNPYGNFAGGAQSGSSAEFQNKYNEYSTKSEGELTGELLKTANRLKNEGKFDVGELEDFFAKSSTFLNDEQRERMRSLIDMLK